MIALSESAPGDERHLDWCPVTAKFAVRRDVLGSQMKYACGCHISRSLLCHIPVDGEHSR